MKFTCPHCEKTYRGKPENVGRRIRCKACEEPFVIEADDEVEDDDLFAEEERPKRRRRRAVAEDDDDELTGGPPPRAGSKSSKKKPKKRRQPAHDDDDDDSEDEEEATPLQMIIGGVVLLAVGIGLYLFFGHLEQEGGNVRMPAIILGVYKLLGKTGLLLVCGGLGVLCLVMGIADMTKRKG